MAVTATPEQLEALLNFMREHSDLARGRLCNDLEGRLRAKRLWKALTDTLNGLGGSVKTTKQWQKVWADKKYSAKKASAASTRSLLATGGGPASAPPLRGVELAVAEIMGENYGLPMSNAYVDAFPGQDENVDPNLPLHTATSATLTIESQQSLSILDMLDLPEALIDSTQISMPSDMSLPHNDMPGPSSAATWYIPPEDRSRSSPQAGPSRVCRQNTAPAWPAAPLARSHSPPQAGPSTVCRQNTTPAWPAAPLARSHSPPQAGPSRVCRQNTAPAWPAAPLARSHSPPQAGPSRVCRQNTAPAWPAAPLARSHSPPQAGPSTVCRQNTAPAWPAAPLARSHSPVRVHAGSPTDEAENVNFPEPVASTRGRRRGNQRRTRNRPDARAKIYELEDRKLEELQALRRSVDNLTDAVKAAVIEIRRLH